MSDQDEITDAMRVNGVHAPTVDRLGRVASDMRHLEWEMLRKSAVRSEDKEADEQN